MRSTSRADLRLTWWVPLALLLWTTCGGDLDSGEPPRQIFLEFQQNYLAAQQNPQPPSIEPVYIQRDTWQASMRASLEATFGSRLAQDRAQRSAGFEPAVVRLTADACACR